MELGSTRTKKERTIEMEAEGYYEAQRSYGRPCMRPFSHGLYQYEESEMPTWSMAGG